jgi:lysozyme family protein
MIDQFHASLDFVLAMEGGLIDHAKDPGGITYKGVSLRAVVGLDYDSDGNLDFDLDGDGDVDAKDILALMREYEAGNHARLESFYKNGYWDATKCDELRWPVSLVVFDSAVNHGPGAAVLMLQRACGVTGDGKIGPATLKAANKPDPHVPALVRRVLVERAYLYHRLSVKRGDDFYRGWMSRLFSLEAESFRRI